MCRAILPDNVSRFFYPSQLFAMVVVLNNVVSVRQSEDISLVMPQFNYCAARVRSESFLLFLVPLSVGIYHYRNVLVGVVCQPLRMPKGNYLEMLPPDFILIISRIQRNIKSFSQDCITPPTSGQKKHEAVLCLVVTNGRAGWLACNVHAAAAGGQRCCDRRYL